ncbi:GNAT family N-acetyltransferase [Pseudoflavitalea sp. G-6-1-2]|uniref:GNAT family N-acetyltransferase n=1 Tax=Pseudoflavitalea sp. G-6-1-2 TaxID=2728841 RepID=UPI001469DFD8|nr:GNAT family N-acetyltransferase [Pseudoflavitalea sp. G-6-1-2]NML22939.1 GNAT family N-acetyltransferase [Pseudoflavitalea sp. G-6-1-2]
MLKAGKQHKAAVVDILTGSFLNNRSVNYVVKQDAKKNERIRDLMAYSFDVCFASGEVFMSDCGRGCALVLYPDKKRTTLRSIGWDLNLAFNVLGISRTAKVMRREGLVKKHHPSAERIFYLWFIGVHTGNQHQGVGKKLLHELMEYSRTQNRPVYLETSTPVNVPWYEQFGFEVYAEEELSYRLFFLRKELL